MNIHGHKLRIAKINTELKKGRDPKLERRKIMHQHIIQNLREKRRPQKTRRRKK